MRSVGCRRASSDDNEQVSELVAATQHLVRPAGHLRQVLLRERARRKDVDAAGSLQPAHTLTTHSLTLVQITFTINYTHTHIYV